MAKISKDKIVKASALDVSSGALAVDLPCGYIKDDEVLDDITLREMTGFDEDILAGQGNITNRLNTIIGNCMISLGSVTDRKELAKIATELTAPDRMVALIALRRVSLGEFFDMSVSCPNCSTSQQFSINLAEMDVTPMEDKKTRVRETELGSGTIAKWHILSATDEAWLAKHRKKKEDRLTLGLLARVEELNGEKLDRNNSYKNAVLSLKRLTTSDRNTLRAIFEKQEGNIDTNIDFECAECEHEWNGSIDVGQPSFFFPSGL